MTPQDRKLDEMAAYMMHISHQQNEIMDEISSLKKISYFILVFLGLAILVAA